MGSIRAQLNINLYLEDVMAKFKVELSNGQKTQHFDTDDAQQVAEATIEGLLISMMEGWKDGFLRVWEDGVIVFAEVFGSGTAPCDN